MPFGATHFPVRSLAETALSSFFKEIIVLGSENVPEEGPLLVACSHTNMVIDVSSIFSCSYDECSCSFAACSSEQHHTAQSSAALLGMCGSGDSFTLFANADILFQVKDSLFANPIVRWILVNAGNIPVDRRNKNNQSLFKGTFEGWSLRILVMSPELNTSLSSDGTRRINRSLP